MSTLSVAKTLASYVRLREPWWWEERSVTTTLREPRQSMSGGGGSVNEGNRRSPHEAYSGVSKRQVRQKQVGCVAQLELSVSHEGGSGFRLMRLRAGGWCVGRLAGGAWLACFGVGLGL